MYLSGIPIYLLTILIFQNCEKRLLLSTQVSSLRYAGMDDIDFPTLTLYHDKNQCGGEFLVLRDTDSLPDFNDKTTTFAVTGSSSWTVYA